MPPRVRFAPSPTGYLHVGGARTALFNWLYARRHGGTFLLRIEDTDVERSSADMVTGILDGLRWLGLTWDEGPEAGGPHAPYFQSERLERYQQAAERLLREGAAYACYCTGERLREERERAEQRGEAWQYDRACLKLSEEQRQAHAAAGSPFAIRFHVREGRTGFDDAVHGRIEFETAKHVLLFEALGAPVPQFAHVPLILGADKKRLSKRHGATSVMEYERQGYLPDAMVNFLALLGWSPGGDRELLSRDELIEAFALDGISGGNAVFNTEKLDWMNAQYLARLPIEQLAELVRPRFVEAGLGQSAVVREPAGFQRLIELLRPRVKRLTEFVEQARPILEAPADYQPDGVEKHLSLVGVRDHVAAVAAALEPVSPFDEPHVEAAVRSTAAGQGLKAGQLIHVVRLALTGRTASPGLFEMIVLLGRDESVARLQRLDAFLAQRI